MKHVHIYVSGYFVDVSSFSVILHGQKQMKKGIKSNYLRHRSFYSKNDTFRDMLNRSTEAHANVSVFDNFSWIFATSDNHSFHNCHVKPYSFFFSSRRIKMWLPLRIISSLNIIRVHSVLSSYIYNLVGRWIFSKQQRSFFSTQKHIIYFLIWFRHFHSLAYHQYARFSWKKNALIWECLSLIIISKKMIEYIIMLVHFFLSHFNIARILWQIWFIAQLRWVFFPIEFFLTSKTILFAL